MIVENEGNNGARDWAIGFVGAATILGLATGVFTMLFNSEGVVETVRQCAQSSKAALAECLISEAGGVIVIAFQNFMNSLP